MAISSGEIVLRSFPQLSGQYQKAVMLKSQGIKHKDIAEQLRAEFNITCSHNTVNQWFSSGGILEQAYNDYNERLADESLLQAQELLKQATLPAVAKLVQLMDDPHPMVRLRASQAILGKYIPDRQSVDIQNPFDDEDLPPELLELANSIVSQP